MLTVVITIVIISTLSGIAGWYFGALCQRRADRKATVVQLKERVVENRRASRGDVATADPSLASEVVQKAEDRCEASGPEFLPQSFDQEIYTALRDQNLLLQNICRALHEVRDENIDIGQSAATMENLLTSAIELRRADWEATQKLQRVVSQVGEQVVVLRSAAAEAQLLATNAAVEAARTGNSGRDFAAFANCVQNLCARSTQSIMEIYRAVDQSRAGLDETVSLESCSDDPGAINAGVELEGFAQCCDQLENLDQTLGRSTAKLDAIDTLVRTSQSNLASLPEILSGGSSTETDSEERESQESPTDEVLSGC